MSLTSSRYLYSPIHQVLLATWVGSFWCLQKDELGRQLAEAKFVTVLCAMYLISWKLLEAWIQGSFNSGGSTHLCPQVILESWDVPALLWAQSRIFSSANSERWSHRALLFVKYPRLQYPEKYELHLTMREYCFLRKVRTPSIRSWVHRNIKCPISEFSK